MMIALFLFALALALLAVGAALAWPVAKRAGRRQALDDELPAWVDLLGRWGGPPRTSPAGARWADQPPPRRGIPPRAPARLSWSDAAALWWAMTNARAGRHV
jgi:hypothetical protein